MSKSEKGAPSRKPKVSASPKLVHAIAGHRSPFRIATVREDGAGHENERDNNIHPYHDVFLVSSTPSDMEKCFRRMR